MQKTYKQLFIMLFIFVIPIIISWILFHYHTYFHLKTLNHGTLISSPIDVKYLYSETESAQQKKWRIIFVANETCDNPCREIDHQLKQVQKALGKDSDRVNTLLLNNKNKQLTKLQTTLHVDPNNKIYLVDPLGNLFMYYASDENPMNILKDLKRVLEVSQIG
jgi:hypothetical protein